MSILKHIRSSTANKRPTASGLADGQLAINTASGTPGVFFKNSASGIVKIGPAHVGATAPNASPAGSAGNSLGEIWINNSTTIQGLNYYNGSSFVNLTPSGTTSVAGLVELATPAETQAGTDGIRAVTPSGLQSKVSDSISTTSSTTIASATAVKTAYDLANAALARTGGTVTGEIVISPSGSISFEGSSDDGFETTLAVVNPTADRIITFPNITGTVITDADIGTVTSTMIANGTIVDEDINASASIALSKLATGALPSGITIDSSNIIDGTIVNADINASAAIAGTKIAPDFGAQNVTTTGTSTAASFIPSSATVPTNGVYLPAANSVAISTNGTGRLFVDNAGRVIAGANTTADLRNGAGVAFTPTLFASTLSGTAGIAAYVNDGTNLRRAGLFVDQDNGIWGLTARWSTGAPAFVINQGLSEHLRITSGGFLGVGTSAPSYLLDVNTNHVRFGNTSGVGLIQLGSSSTASQNFHVGATGSTVRLWNGNIGSGSELLRITSAGLVGIGTTSPAESLFVSGNIGLTGSSPTKIYTNANELYLGADEDNNNSSSVITFNVDASERARIDSSGRLLVGTSTVINVPDGEAGVIRSPSFQLAGNGFANTINSIAFFNTSVNGAGCLSFTRSNTSTVGNHTVVTDGSRLGKVGFSGSDGSKYVEAVTITASVDGIPGADDMPGRLVFSTTADGASSPTERLRIASDGLHTINSSAHSGAALGITAPAKLYIASGTYTDTTTAASGVVSHGTIVAFDNPAINSTNSAVVYTNASTVYIDGAPTATGNVTVTNPYALYVNAGTSFFGGNVNLSSGNEYRINNTKVVGARVSGWTAATGTATRTTFDTSTVTTAQLAERVKALIDDLISHGLIGT